MRITTPMKQIKIIRRIKTEKKKCKMSIILNIAKVENYTFVPTDNPEEYEKKVETYYECDYNYTVGNFSGGETIPITIKPNHITIHKTFSNELPYIDTATRWIFKTLKTLKE